MLKQEKRIEDCYAICVTKATQNGLEYYMYYINEVSHFNSAGRDIERINIRVCLRTVICILLSDLKLRMLELRC